MMFTKNCINADSTTKIVMGNITLIQEENWMMVVSILTEIKNSGYQKTDQNKNRGGRFTFFYIYRYLWI